MPKTMLEQGSHAGKTRSLTREKLDQAARLVKDAGFGAWVVFVRETAHGSDPVLPLILEGGLTWLSALLVTTDGKKVAFVGNYDADPLIASGDWDEVVPYVQDFKPAFLGVLQDHVPAGSTIGLDYSLSDQKADGLTHGLWLLLKEMTKDTRFETAFVSAEPLVSRLRGQKSSSEVGRIQAAIAEGDRLFDDIADFARIGVTEREVFDHVHRLISQRGLGFAWDSTGDPIVNSGPDSMVGHGVPSPTISLQPGHVFHVDLGVEVNGYCSDVQRCWFVGETVPDDVREAADAVNEAISAAADALTVGAMGWEIDQAARASIVKSGYPEYMHAVGHQVGRSAHDGGTVLAPQWARYGQTPFGRVQKDEVYTLELGVFVDGRGYLGIEEMVLVTDGPCLFLTERQLELTSISG